MTTTTSRNICVIGDSITEYNFRAAKNWVTYLQEWNNWQIQNLGISGTGFIKSNPYINRVNQIHKDTEMIGVAISFNDLNTNADIGTIAKLDDNSIIGASYKFFTTLQTNYPDIKIIAYVQNKWAKANPAYSNSNQLIENIALICQRLNIPFYSDMYYKDKILKPWDIENCKKYFTSDNINLGPYGLVDSIHPNSSGHKIIAKYLDEKFKENLM